METTSEQRQRFIDSIAMLIAAFELDDDQVEQGNEQGWNVLGDKSTRKVILQVHLNAAELERAKRLAKTL